MFHEQFSTIEWIHGRNKIDIKDPNGRRSFKYSNEDKHELLSLTDSLGLNIFMIQEIFSPVEGVVKPSIGFLAIPGEDMKGSSVGLVVVSYDQDGNLKRPDESSSVGLSSERPEFVSEGHFFTADLPDHIDFNDVVGRFIKQAQARNFMNPNLGTPVKT